MASFGAISSFTKKKHLVSKILIPHKWLSNNNKKGPPFKDLDQYYNKSLPNLNDLFGHFWGARIPLLKSLPFWGFSQPVGHELHRSVPSHRHLLQHWQYWPSTTIRSKGWKTSTCHGLHGAPMVGALGLGIL